MAQENIGGFILDKRKVIYYQDELNDEFSLAEITPRVIDGSYEYCKDSLWKKFTRFFWYRIVAMPIAYFYCKHKFHHKIIGAEKLKEFKKTGYFLYGNHTQDIGDAFMPNLINPSKRKYIVVHPNNVSIPVIGPITPSLGALPLPGDAVAHKNFARAIEKRYNENNGIVIYPEAHIWPFYTGIRPFGEAPFHYPVRLKAPTFCFTNTYQKRKGSDKPRIVTYVDGPFYPNPELSIREQKIDLRNQVYACMCERAKLSTVEWIKYIKKETEND